MSNDTNDPRGRQVPRGRLSRLSQFGRLAGSVAGGMIAEGGRRLAAGERPQLRDMLLTPGNVGKVADRLSHLRGAAMKLGQMISMDAGDLLPAELTAIMARLRDNAQHMPAAQLQQVLTREWGPDWRARFSHFDHRPIAAASIGQVHRAIAKDGRELAIKVQYPGVRESIDADVGNVATLLRMSGVLPRGFDVGPLLEEAKRQLAEEADYEREGEYMVRLGRLLADMPEVIVPTLESGLTTSRVLAMTFLEGRPIESLETASQDVRDAEGYRRLLRASLSGDRVAVRDAAVAAGFLGPAVVARHGAAVDQIIDVILGELNRPGLFDFGDRRFVEALRGRGMEIAADAGAWHLPPTDILFVQRKISGTALLASRLKARVDIREIVQPWLGEPATVPPVRIQ